MDALRRRSGSCADLVAATAQFSCPSARGLMTVYAQDLMAADTGCPVGADTERSPVPTSPARGAQSEAVPGELASTYASIRRT